jgi:hypothetical protein
MSKPFVHAISSAKRHGGLPEHYISLHDFMDTSKGSGLADNRHRALTHNAWFIAPGGPLERVFGHVLEIPTEEHGMVGNELQVLEEKVRYHEEEIRRTKEQMRKRKLVKLVSVRDIGEQHILEDFQGRFIPTAQDYLEGMEMHEWMCNGNRGMPPSMRKIAERKVVTRKVIDLD